MDRRIFPCPCCGFWTLGGRNALQYKLGRRRLVKSKHRYEIIIYWSEEDGLWQLARTPLALERRTGRQMRD